MLLLGEQKYFHSYIQPENVTLVQVKSDNRYLAKVVDFGELSRDELVQNTLTLNYFPKKYSTDSRMSFSLL
jgi:hypothetical protein